MVEGGRVQTKAPPATDIGMVWHVVSQSWLFDGIIVNLSSLMCLTRDILQDTRLILHQLYFFINVMIIAI